MMNKEFEDTSRLIGEIVVKGKLGIKHFKSNVKKQMHLLIFAFMFPLGVTVPMKIRVELGQVLISASLSINAKEGNQSFLFTAKPGITNSHLLEDIQQLQKILSVINKKR